MSERDEDDEEDEFKRRLLEDVADLVNTYLKGEVRVPDVRTEDPESNIERMETLLIRYFIFSGIDNVEPADIMDPTREQEDPQVVPFVRRLPGRVQRIKTTTKPNTEIARGRVEGKIDWQKTAEERSRRGTTEDGLFVCRHVNDEIQTLENEILATLVDRIHSTVEEVYGKIGDDDDGDDDEERWHEGWRKEDGSLRQIIEEIKFDNPYISEVDVEETPLSTEKISSVKQARTPLYREAAKLLDRYQRYRRGECDEDELIDLFNQLFVAEEDTSKLFEVYWGYKLLSGYKDRKLKPLLSEDDSNLMAKWSSSEYEYRLSYAAIDDKGGVEQSISVDDIKEELETLSEKDFGKKTYLEMKEEAVSLEEGLKGELLGISPQLNIWSGVPDLFLSKREADSNELRGVFVGEVKYSEKTSDSYISSRASDGVGDLSEYMKLLRHQGEYISEKDEISLMGGVFTRDFEPEKRKSEDENVFIYTYGDDVEPPV